jgi:hypothetical protein
MTPVAKNRSGARQRGPSPEARLEELALQISAREGLSEDAQNLAARIFDLLADVEHHPDRVRLFKAATVGLQALCTTPPNIRLAEASTKFLRYRIRSYRRPLRAMSREAPGTWLLIGLMALIASTALFIGIAESVFGADVQGEVLGLAADDVILVFVFGAVGAGVSVLQRLQKFDEDGTNPVMLFCTGLTKPVVGAASAVFLYVLVTSGIVAIDLTQYDDTAFFASVAFVAGFSERLLPDLAHRAEAVLSVAATDTTPVTEPGERRIALTGLADRAEAAAAQQAQQQGEDDQPEADAEPALGAPPATAESPLGEGPPDPSRNGP